MPMDYIQSNPLCLWIYWNLAVKMGGVYTALPLILKKKMIFEIIVHFAWPICQLLSQ